MIKRIVLSALLSLLFASNLMAQDKPMISMHSQATLGDSITFYMQFHKATTAYVVHNGDSLPIVSSGLPNKLNKVRMKLENNFIEIYGDASTVKRFQDQGFWEVSLSLDSIDVSACTELEHFELNNSEKLQKVDVTSNTKLKYLRLTNCGLSEINIAHLTQLNTLNLLENNLTAIEFPQSDLQNVYLSENKFQQINLLGLSDKLSDFSVAGNQLSYIDLSHFTMLKEINCEKNQLETLILPTNMDSLTALDLEKNRLSTIDLSQAKNLRYLKLGHNQLTELKLPENGDLRKLNIEHNQLAGEFVLPQYASLYELKCNDNQFTAIDVSRTRKLETLDFENNNLPPNKLPFVDYTVDWDKIRTDYGKRVVKEKREAAEAKEEKRRNSKFYKFKEKAFPNPNFSFAVDAGYVLTGNKYGTNQGYLGAVIGFSNETKRSYQGGNIHQVWLGFGVFFGRYNSKESQGIPAFTVVYSPFALYTRLSVSKYHMHPSIGVNALNIMQLHLGYSYGYHRKNGIRMSGPTLGINITLGANHMFDLSS